MPGTEIVRKQTTLGGAAGIALLGFALVYRFFPTLIHVDPVVRAPAPDVVPSVTTRPIGVTSPTQSPATELTGPPISLAPPPETIVTEPEQPELPATANVSALLAQADKALADGHLADPDDDNALALYRQVLAEDANNRRALAGVVAVRNGLLERIDAALALGDADVAAPLLTAAALADLKAAELESRKERLVVVRQIAPLLARAAVLLKQGRVTEPAGDNALEIYRRVQELDAENALAIQGLEQIQRDVLDGALAAVAKDDFVKADSTLAEAARVLPGSQQLLDTRTRVEGVRRQRAETVLAQARSALDSGDADLAEKLVTRALAISADLPAIDEFNEKLRNARLYASFRPGQGLTDPFLDRSGSAPPLLVIPAGKYVMGTAPDEEGTRASEQPPHEVVFPIGFALGRNEVTVGEFRAFIHASAYVTTAEKVGGSNIYDENSGRMTETAGISWQDDYRGKRAPDNLPVIHISWDDSTAYLDWLSARTGKKYRLPSEAEFEYALRAGSSTRFWWGNGSPTRVVANVTGAGDRSPAHRTWRKAFPRYDDGHWGPSPVRNYPANPFGVYDIDGNVSEWVADCWHENYVRAPRDSRAWINPGCDRHVVRGGSWGSDPDQVRSAFRISALTATRSARVGFRVARDL